MSGRSIFLVVAGVVIALAAVAAGAYFFVQHRIQAEIETGFRQFADNPPPPYRNVTYGKIAFTLHNRRVVVENFAALAGEAGDQLAVSRLELEGFDPETWQKITGQTGVETQRDDPFRRVVDRAVATRLTVVQGGRTFEASTFILTDFDVRPASAQAIAKMGTLWDAERAKEALAHIRIGSLSVNELRAPVERGDLAAAQVEIVGLRDERFKSLVFQGLTFAEPDGKTALGRFEVRDGLSAVWLAPQTRKTTAERMAILDFSALKFSDFRTQSRGPKEIDIAISSVDFGAVDSKKLSSFVIAGLVMAEKGPNPVNVKIAGFELRDLDWEQLLPLVSDLAERPDLSATDVQSRLQRIGMLRYGIGKVAFTGMELAPGISMAELSLRGVTDKGTGDADLIINDFVVKAADLEDRNTGASLSAFGYGTLSLGLRMRAVSNESAGTAALEKLDIFGPQVGKLSISYAVSNYRPAEAPPENPLAPLLAASIDTVDIGWQDEGLTQRALVAAARQQRSSITQLKTALAQQMRQTMQAFGNSPRIAELSNALVAYLEKPGALAISAKPQKPVPVADIMALLEAGPGGQPDLPALFDVLEIRASAR